MKFIAVMVLGLLILVALVMLLLRGCAPKAADPGSASSTSISQQGQSKGGSDDDADPSEDPESDSGGSDSSDSDASQDPEDADASAKDKEPEETVVKVKLKEKGAVAWIEVKLDGKVVLGKQVVGPFEQEFNVETQIDITTNTPSAVAVYKNGEKVRYDTKVSGVGKISILAPKKEESEKVVDSDGDGSPDMTVDEAKEAGVAIPEDILAAAETSGEQAADKSSEQ